MQYQDILQKTGLSAPQAEVYEVLLMHGEYPAGPLTRLTSLKRGLVYKVLEDLVEMQLVEKTELEGKVATFAPKHPTHLRELVETRQKALKDAEIVLDGFLPSLTSSFNLISGTPGVSVYEGIEGVQKVLEDSLTSRTEILQYADLEVIVRYSAKSNEKYVTKRSQKDIQTRGLVVDSEFNRQYLTNYHKMVTESRFIKLPPGIHFESLMKIYDGKIAYITYAEKSRLGVIIEDERLYNLHKTLFEYMWQLAEQGNPLSMPQDFGAMSNPDFR
jgi:sugar-specific transcriptional regulator TrmB